MAGPRMGGVAVKAIGAAMLLVLVAGACRDDGGQVTASGGAPEVELLFPRDGMVVIPEIFVAWEQLPGDEADTALFSIDGDVVHRTPAWFHSTVVSLEDHPAGPLTLTLELLDEAGSILARTDTRLELERFEPGQGFAVLGERYDAGNLSADELFVAGMFLVQETNPEMDEEQSATGAMLALMSLRPEVTSQTQRAFELMTQASMVENDRYEAWEARQPDD